MKVKDFIRKDNWTQRALARDSEGGIYNWPYSENIYRWCLSGMILLCYREDGLQHNILAKVKQYLIDTDRESDGNIGRWNDRPERTWHEVQQLSQELDI